MEEETEIHPIFKKDPEDWMQFVYKQVSVLSEDGVEHMGWVYTIDPVSESIVLVTFPDDQTKLEIILGHAVTKINVISEDTESHKEKLNSLFHSELEVSLSVEEIKKKQDLLKLWLEKNRLPVSVGGPRGELLTISDALTIEPPYAPENCRSSNEIILGRIQGLIKTMPPDHDRWM